MSVMLEFALGAIATLLMSKRGGAAPSGKPSLTVIPGGKAPKKKKVKAKLMPTSSTPQAPQTVVLQQSEQPGLMEMVRALPPPADPSTADGQLGSATPRAAPPPKKAAKPPKKTKPASTRIARPARPTPPKAAARPAPTAKSLAKPSKRAPKKAAEDLRDYLNAGGNAGTKNNRSQFVAQCQADMGGIAADGVIGPATRQRAAKLGVSIKPRT